MVLTEDQSRHHVIQTRGQHVENRHAIHVAVVQASGQLALSMGDPSLMFFPRSTIKPAQALSILRSGCFDEFSFDDADLALMCASHSSEAMHIERGLAMLSKLGLDETSLHCGGHDSLSKAVCADWIRRGFRPSAVCNDCSGKHIGMLASSLKRNVATEGYHMQEHPTQVHVKRTVADALDLDLQAISWAVDGCNLPAPRIPLRSLALLYARLAAANDGHGDKDMARVFRAMATYPELVAGTDRFCTNVMQIFGESIIAKVGADGCYALGVSGDAPRTETANCPPGAFGVAFKIEDGNFDMLYLAVADFIHRLGLGTPEQRRILESWRFAERRSTTGDKVGRTYSLLPEVRNYSP